MSAGGGRKAVIAAMLANAGIAATKVVAFVFSGSASMLSEAIHSAADTLNQGLLLVGAAQGKRPATKERPFGYGRSRYILAFIVAVVLFLGGGVFSLAEGWHKWQHPDFDAETAWLPITVLAIAIILESLSFRTAIVEANRARGALSLTRFVRQTRQPELPVVLLEDLGALVGLVFALSAVVLSLLTGDGRWDGAGAMAIGVLLLLVAIILFIELFSMLLGEAALPEYEAEITRCVRQHAVLGDVIHLRTAHMGPDELLVGIKVAVDPDSRSADVAAAVDEVEASIRAVVPSATWIYIETDVLDPRRG